jgi:hypothetical protein
MEVSGGAPAAAAAEDRMLQYRISRTLGVGSFGKVTLTSDGDIPKGRQVQSQGPATCLCCPHPSDAGIKN